MLSRAVLSRLHFSVALAALALIFVFQSATILAEAFGGAPDVVAVKSAIAWGLLALIPLLAAAGASGRALAGGGVKSGPIARKMARMRLMALNGILVLAPAALFLAWRAKAGRFDVGFASIQTLELAAGLLNLTLGVLNARDGLAQRRQVKVA